MMNRKVILATLCVAIMVSLYTGGFCNRRIGREIKAEIAILEEIEAELQKLREILDERKLVVELDQDGKDREIEGRFQQVSEELEHSYDVGDRDDIYFLHTKMRYVYKDIRAVEDLYAFYDGLYHYLNGNTAKTLERMTFVMDNYPNSKKIKQACHFGLDIYIARGMDDDYVGLYHQYPQFSTTKYRYWLGQAYYNLDNYEEAEKIFIELNNDSQYGFRSKLMMGMINIVKYEYEEGLDAFLDLTEQYPISEPYYDFAVLSIARIYSQLGYYSESLGLYNDYEKINYGKLPSDLIYEKGLVAKEAGRVDLAMELFREVVNQPQTSQMFDKALSQIAKIQADRVNIGEAKQIVEDVVGTNESHKELMRIQSSRLVKLRAQVSDYITSSSSPVRKRDVEREIEQFTDVKESHNKIGLFGVNKDDVEIIGRMLEEYAQLMKIIIEKDDLVQEVAQKSNDKKAENIEQQINEKDSLRVDLLAYQFLSNVSHEDLFDDDIEWRQILRPTGFQERLKLSREIKEKIDVLRSSARNIAKKIVDKENIISDQPQTDNSSIREEINLLFAEAESLFGELDYNDEKTKMIKEEFESLTDLRRQLIDIKDLVAQFYHQKLSEKLDRSNRAMFEDSEYTHTDAINRINNFMGDLDDMNLEYNYALLDLQFKEVLKKEREFNALRTQTNVQDLGEVMYDE